MAEQRERTFGEYLQQVQFSKGWPLREAARHVGIAHSRVDEVEKIIAARTGKRCVPSYFVVVKYAKAYGLPSDELGLSLRSGSGTSLDHFEPWRRSGKMPCSSGSESGLVASSRCEPYLPSIEAEHVQGDGYRVGFYWVELQWNDLIEKAKVKVAAHQRADQNYQQMATEILELVQSAHSLFLQQNTTEQQELLKHVLSNCVLKSDQVAPEYRKPFDLIVFAATEFGQKNSVFGPSDPKTELKWA